MRRLYVALLVLAAGCRFDPGGGGGGSGDIDGPVPDIDADPGAPDADPTAPDAEPPPPDAEPPPPDAEPPPDSEPPPVACPAGYEASGDPGLEHRYRYVPSPQRTWIEAASDCADDLAPYTYLVVIDDDAESVAVDALSSNRDIWVGATDGVNEGNWRDLFGGPLGVDLWEGGEPDNGGDPNDVPGQDCAEQREGGAWRDVACDQSRRFVCECDPTATPAGAP